MRFQASEGLISAFIMELSPKKAKREPSVGAAEILSASDAEAVYWGQFHDILVEKTTAFALKYRETATKYTEVFKSHGQYTRNKRVSIRLIAQWDMPPMADPVIKSQRQTVEAKMGWKRFERLSKFVHSFIYDILKTVDRNVSNAPTATDYCKTDWTIPYTAFTGSSAQACIEMCTEKTFPKSGK